MKIPIEFSCIYCGKEQYIPILLSDHNPKWKCNGCGQLNDGIFGPSVTNGFKLILRSQYELKENDDYCLSIVFSAMAVDCELSRLFIKWTEIEDLGNKILNEKASYEKMLKKFRGNKEKFNGVIRLLYPGDLDVFFQNNPDLISRFKKLIPSFTVDSMYNHIDEQLFWKRNRILHLGDSTYNKADAIKCLKIADSVLDLLYGLEEEKKKELNN